MFFRILFFLLGILISSLGLSYILLYSNLLSIGYNFKEYVQYIVSDYKCWYLGFGLVIILIVIYIPRRKNNE